MILSILRSFPRAPKPLIGALLGLSLIAGCADLRDDGVLSQNITVDSVPTGGTCDIYTLGKDHWENLAATREHRKAVAKPFSGEELWYAGVPLDAVPAGSTLLVKGLQLPTSVKVNRTNDFLIADCTGRDGETAVRGYTYEGNTNATLLQLADPTLIGARHVFNNNGYSYLFPNFVEIPLS